MPQVLRTSKWRSRYLILIVLFRSLCIPANHYCQGRGRGKEGVQKGGRQGMPVYYPATLQQRTGLSSLKVNSPRAVCAEGVIRPQISCLKGTISNLLLTATSIKPSQSLALLGTHLPALLHISQRRRHPIHTPPLYPVFLPPPY